MVQPHGPESVFLTFPKEECEKYPDRPPDPQTDGRQPPPSAHRRRRRTENWVAQTVGPATEHKNRTLQLYGKVIPGRVRQPPRSGRQPTDSNSGDLGLPSRPKPRPRLRQGENITLGSGGVNGNIVSEWWDGHEAHSHT